MLAGLLGVRRHAHAIAFLQGQAQLQRIDGIQTQAIHKQCLAGIDVLRLNVFQRQRGNDEFFDFLLKLKHVKAL